MAYLQTPSPSNLEKGLQDQDRSFPPADSSNTQNYALHASPDSNDASSNNTNSVVKQYNAFCPSDHDANGLASATLSRTPAEPTRTPELRAASGPDTHRKDHSVQGAPEMKSHPIAHQPQPKFGSKNSCCIECSRRDLMKDISEKDQEILRLCAIGQHPELWYKFKRFETLSLLNLYNYQHELVQLEKRIMAKRGVMNTEERHLLSVMLKDYRTYPP